MGVSWHDLDVLLHLWLPPWTRVILRANESLPFPSSPANGSPSVNAVTPCAKGCIVFTLKKWGSWTANRPGPTALGPYRPGLVTPSHTWVLLPLVALWPLQLCHFGYVILTSKIEGLLAWSSVFTLQSSGMFLCNTLVLSTFVSCFIMHLNTNRTPHLLLWTCCDSILFSMFSYKNITLPNAHTKMNLLYH
jgi:hypothetical protein